MRAASWLEVFIFIGVFISLVYFVTLTINKGIVAEQRYIDRFSELYNRIISSIVILNDINIHRPTIYVKSPYIIFLNSDIISQCTNCVYINYSKMQNVLYIVGNNSPYYSTIRILLNYSSIYNNNSDIICSEISGGEVTNIKYDCEIITSGNFLITINNPSPYIILSDIDGEINIVVGNNSYFIYNIGSEYSIVYKKSNNIIEKIYIVA